MITSQQDQIYRLGKITFRIINGSPRLRTLAASLLPVVDIAEQDTQAANVVTIDMEDYEDIRPLINNVLRKHDGTIWIDAGCLLSPSGKRYLIIGKSSAGKSTLTMAMALGCGWKVVTEDLVLIDASNDRLFTFATPFSFKKGTVELLEESIGKNFADQLMGEWLPLQGVAAPASQPASFDFSVILKERDKQRPFELCPASPKDLVRELVKCSNLIREDHFPEKMFTYLSSGQCFTGRFGSVKERMDALESFDSCTLG